MHEVVIALAYIGIIVAPVVFATTTGAQAHEPDASPESSLADTEQVVAFSGQPVNH